MNNVNLEHNVSANHPVYIMSHYSLIISSTQPCGANFGPIWSKSWYVRDIILYKLVYEYESSSPKSLDEIL